MTFIALFLFCSTRIHGFSPSNTDAPDQEANSFRNFTDSIRITYIQPFRIDSDKLVSSPELRAFSAEVDSIMSTDSITRAEIIGMASIDGPVSLNERLAKARAKAMQDWLLKTTSIPDSVFFTEARGEDWNIFRSLVVNDKNIPAREQLLNIIDSKNDIQAKEMAIRRLDGGKTWSYLAMHVFPLMRSAEVILDVKHRFIVPLPEEMIEVEEVEEVYEAPVVEMEEQVTEVVAVAPVDEWRRRMYIKTDLPYWLMSWSNVAFEWDLAPHFSFNLPIYFSAMNYIKRDIKFRTLSFQPGFRYWFKPDNKGAYLEAHYGMGWWNFAFGGKYRYQDHYRQTPTMGGGIGAGYRLPVSKNGRWAMEFGGGVGVYRLNYDRFINKPDGKLVDSHKKTVFFIDNINVSISYSFPIEKKKGGNL